ncbi:hypothetical protein FG93_01955 [Bosea sp. LC85]|nr:hypothetical protein FG93_01955 [Bosea sp. LC85]
MTLWTLHRSAIAQSPHHPLNTRVRSCTCTLPRLPNLPRHRQVFDFSRYSPRPFMGGKPGGQPLPSLASRQSSSRVREGARGSGCCGRYSDFTWTPT